MRGEGWEGGKMAVGTEGRGVVCWNSPCESKKDIRCAKGNKKMMIDK